MWEARLCWVAYRSGGVGTFVEMYEYREHDMPQRSTQTCSTEKQPFNQLGI